MLRTKIIALHQQNHYILHLFIVTSYLPRKNPVSLFLLFLLLVVLKSTCLKQNSILFGLHDWVNRKFNFKLLTIFLLYDLPGADKRISDKVVRFITWLSVLILVIEEWKLEKFPFIHSKVTIKSSSVFKKLFQFHEQTSIKK